MKWPRAFLYSVSLLLFPEYSWNLWPLTQCNLGHHHTGKRAKHWHGNVLVLTLNHESQTPLTGHSCLLAKVRKFTDNSLDGHILFNRIKAWHSFSPNTSSTFLLLSPGYTYSTLTIFYLQDPRRLFHNQLLKTKPKKKRMVSFVNLCVMRWVAKWVYLQPFNVCQPGEEE